MPSENIPILLEVVIGLNTLSDQEKMLHALQQVTEEDSFFHFRILQEGHAIISGMDEEHLEGKIEILRDAYHLDLRIGEPQILYRTAASGMSEPFMKIEITVPEDYRDLVISDLGKRRGRIQGEKARDAIVVIVATVPLARMSGYRNTLRSISEGNARYVMHFDHFAPVPAN